MLMPKRTKWRKQMRGRIRGEASRGNEVAFGEHGLQALEQGWVSARFDTCEPGVASGDSRALPTTPVVTSAERVLAHEAMLMAHADSLEAVLEARSLTIRTLEGRVSAERSRVDELEAELERITALLRDGPRPNRVPGGR
jgi:hypothetical protein